MNNRVFICRFYKFPRGSASANYVQYFSLALIQAGYQVILITDVNSEEKDYLSKLEKKYGDALIVDEIVRPQNKVGRFVQFNYSIGMEMISHLSRLKPTKDDIVISYSSRKVINNSIWKYAHSKVAALGAIVVEWYPDDYFADRKQLKEYKENFEGVLTTYDFLLPISTYIDTHFKAQGNKTFCIPIMSDPSEYEYKEKIISGKRKFIYPANGRMKDELSEMIVAICKLSPDERNKAEFHFTGVKKSTLIEIVGNVKYSEIENCVFLHEWLKYDALVELYRDCHFLLLARKESQLTLANFPSKVPEVMCHGVVPIVSEVGDYTKYYLRNEENAIFLDGYEADEIKQGILRALRLGDNEYMDMSRNAYNMVCSKLSYANWAEQLGSFLEEVSEHDGTKNTI